jgi:hypothetical protein
MRFRMKSLMAAGVLATAILGGLSTGRAQAQAGYYPSYPVPVYDPNYYGGQGQYTPGYTPFYNGYYSGGSLLPYGRTWFGNNYYGGRSTWAPPNYPRSTLNLVPPSI